MNIKRRIEALEQQRNPGYGLFIVSSYPDETDEDAIARARKEQGIADDEELGLVVTLQRFATDECRNNGKVHQ